MEYQTTLLRPLFLIRLTFTAAASRTLLLKTYPHGLEAISLLESMRPPDTFESQVRTSSSLKSHPARISLTVTTIRHQRHKSSLEGQLLKSIPSLRKRPQPSIESACLRMLECLFTGPPVRR